MLMKIDRVKIFLITAARSSRGGCRKHAFWKSKTNTGNTQFILGLVQKNQGRTRKRLKTYFFQISLEIGRHTTFNSTLLTASVK